jgi:type II secretory pathway predicted ATPase ExeA
MLDVYKSCYKFSDQPFRLSPDSRFCFGHPSYDNAKAYLKYAISEGEGFVAITGAPGTGKTTLISSLLAELDSRHVQVATLANVQLDEGNLVDRVLEAFVVEFVNANRSKVTELHKYLIQNSQKDCRSIMIVDEAQGMSVDALESLRLLSNLEHDNRLLLQVFLVGQEPLLDLIRAPGMEQLHQRFIAASNLEPLELEESTQYIEHRLRNVGWQDDPSFSDEAFKLIHKFSNGIPRRINLICHRLFLYAGLGKKHKLVGSDALHVIVELHKEGLLSPVVRRSLVS